MNNTTRDSTSLSPLLTVREAADVLRISERTLWTLTQNGTIRSVRIGRSVRYDQQDLADWIETQKSASDG